MEPMDEETFTQEENEAWQAFAQALPTYTLDDLPHPDIHTYENGISLYKREGQWYPVQNEAWFQYRGDAPYELREENGNPVLITTHSSTGPVSTIAFGIEDSDDDEDGVIIVRYTGIAGTAQ